MQQTFDKEGKEEARGELKTLLEFTRNLCWSKRHEHSNTRRDAQKQRSQPASGNLVASSERQERGRNGIQGYCKETYGETGIHCLI